MIRKTILIKNHIWRNIYLSRLKAITFIPFVEWTIAKKIYIFLSDKRIFETHRGVRVKEKHSPSKTFSFEN